MADPNLKNIDCLYDDHGGQCNNHIKDGPGKHGETNITDWYHSWNARVLKYMPCKDLGNIRYNVEVETAPHPTLRSPKMR